MNLNEMQSTWNSPRNHLATEEQRKLAQQFSRQMIRRRRFQSIWLINTIVWLTLITVVVGWMLASGKTQFGQEWGVLLLLLAPWAFAIHFLRRHLKPVVPVVRGDRPVADSFRAALNANRMEKSHLRQVAGLFVIMIPLLALGLHQLHAVGKVSHRELNSMVVFFAAVLLPAIAGLATRYFGRLLPQQKLLDALLTELADEVK